LDQLEIVDHLRDATDAGIWKAIAVYEKGAHSKPYAVLKLEIPLAKPLTVGESVIGLSTLDKDSIEGTINGDYPISMDTTGQEIEVYYDISPDQENYVNCQVGASATPNTQGCKYNEPSMLRVIAAPLSKLTYLHRLQGPGQFGHYRIYWWTPVQLQHIVGQSKCTYHQTFQ